jgi:hypothetical protein
MQTAMNQSVQPPEPPCSVEALKSFYARAQTVFGAFRLCYTTQTKLQQGFVLHQQGRFSEAEGLYEEVLRTVPSNGHEY